MLIMEQNKKIVLLTFFIAFFWLTVRSAMVDTVTTYSASMKKQIKAVVVTPDNYAGAKELPVLYLLHGYSGNYADWVLKAKGFDVDRKKVHLKEIPKQVGTYTATLDLHKEVKHEIKVKVVAE